MEKHRVFKMFFAGLDTRNVAHTAAGALKRICCDRSS